MILYTALKAFRELLIRKAIITLYNLFPYITTQFFLNVIFKGNCCKGVYIHGKAFSQEKSFSIKRVGLLNF